VFVLSGARFDRNRQAFRKVNDAPRHLDLVVKKVQLRNLELRQSWNNRLRKAHEQRRNIERERDPLGDLFGVRIIAQELYGADKNVRGNHTKQRIDDKARDKERNERPVVSLGPCKVANASAGE
jgi:hypothetical protein